MKLTRLLAGAAFVATLAGASGAFASPIVLPGGPLYGKFSGVEQVAPGNDTVGVGSPYLATSGNTGADCAGCVQEPTAANNTEGTFGAFIVTTLSPGAVTIPNQHISQNGSPFFVDGQNGGNQITGFFYGTTLTSFSTTGATGNGGIVDLYWWDKNNQTQANLDGSNPAALRTSQTQFTGYTCANAPAGSSGCTLLAQLDLVPRAVDNGATVRSDTDRRGCGRCSSGGTVGTSNFYPRSRHQRRPGRGRQQLSRPIRTKNFGGLLLPLTSRRSRSAGTIFQHCTTRLRAAWNGPGVCSARIFARPVHRGCRTGTRLDRAARHRAAGPQGPRGAATAGVDHNRFAANLSRFVFRPGRCLCYRPGHASARAAEASSSSFADTPAARRVRQKLFARPAAICRQSSAFRPPPRTVRPNAEHASPAAARRDHPHARGGASPADLQTHKAGLPLPASRRRPSSARGGRRSGGGRAPPQQPRRARRNSFRASTATTPAHNSQAAAVQAAPPRRSTRLGSTR